MMMLFSALATECEIIRLPFLLSNSLLLTFFSDSHMEKLKSKAWIPFILMRLVSVHKKNNKQLSCASIANLGRHLVCLLNR